MHFITYEKNYLTHPQVICVIYATNISDTLLPQK